MRYILRMTKEVYYCYTDGAGNILERPIGNIGKRGLTKDKDDFLKKYINLIINTGFISETTKIFIRSSLPSVASVINDYNRMVDKSEAINIKTAQSNIDYNIRMRLLKYFPDDMLNKIVAYKECNLKEYEKMLNLALADSIKGNNLIADNLILKLPHTDIRESCSDEEFSELMSLIAPYFKKSIKYVENNLPESVGYLLYIISTATSSLSFEDKERYELLRGMLE